MNKKPKKIDVYQGFEQGPIRPPSEANSLLIRFTRNCPWNRCTFCTVYKKHKFSLRSVANIEKDINILKLYIDAFIKYLSYKDLNIQEVQNIFHSIKPQDRVAFNAALNWFISGMESIFIQDANSLIMKPDHLVFVLRKIKRSFPMVKRITSYARSHTIARIKNNDMKRFASAGLDRIHIGLESGSDKVLSMVHKGASKETHIKAGLKVRAANIELSEYIMPGLGGVELSEEHALETANVLNAINPHFIRIRTLAMPVNTLLGEQYQQGKFKRCTDVMMIQELRLMIDTLDNISSYVKSDHILNLVENIEGRMPMDKKKMLRIIDQFLKMEPEQKLLYQVGRRIGVFRTLNDIKKQSKVEKAKEFCELNGVTSENIDNILYDMMKRFV